MSDDHAHVSSLVSDLVQMAQATARLPELEAQLREAEKAIADLISRNETLERKIESEVAINTDLAGKLHAAEVARDDAGFRQLEAEDRIGLVQIMLTNMFHGVGTTLATLSGDAMDQPLRMTKAEREEFREYQNAKDRAAAQQAEEAAKPIDPTPASGIYEQPQSAQSVSVDSPTTAASTEGQSATDPTGESLGDTPLPSAEPSPWSPIGYYSGADQLKAEGVSVSPDPTASQPTSPSETAPVTSAPEQAGAPTGKYANRRYADWPYYVSEESWVANGGTLQSYWDGRAGWANAPSPTPKTA